MKNKQGKGHAMRNVLHEYIQFCNLYCMKCAIATYY
jgi:hypothetical protein